MLDINDVLRVVLTWNYDDNSLAQLVWHYIQTVGNGGDPDDALDAIETMMQTAWASIDNIITDTLVATTMKLLQWDFTNHRWDGVAERSVTSLDGLGAGEYLPHGSAALVKIHTEVTRRQGRKFIPGLLEGGVADGFITSGNLVLFADFADDFDVDISYTAKTLKWCTFNVDDESPLYETASKAVDSITAEGVMAYQRRRKPGVGLT